MIYKIRLIHTVADEDGYFSILWKDFDIPFVPWVGLSIADWDAGYNGVGNEIKTMLWSVTLNSFVAHTPGEKWGKKENSQEVKREVDEAREKHIQSLIDDGWTNDDDDLE